MTDFILILDFGSQYTQLIARRLRELKVYCEIHPYNIDIKKIIKEKIGYKIKGVILSGGPSSVKEIDSPSVNIKRLQKNLGKKIPLLGICYGMQLIVHQSSDGKVKSSLVKEYGNTRIKLSNKSSLFEGVPDVFSVWMSHGDTVEEVPDKYEISSVSRNGFVSSIENYRERIYGIQFHPEVKHTSYGEKILSNFVFGICKVNKLFEFGSFLHSKIKDIKNTIANDYVICALSGGVDSTVAALIVRKAVGDRLICIHIDNGLMRKDESINVIRMFKENFKFNLRFVDASTLFLKRLKNIHEPEKKRKIIGKTFIEVFEKECRNIKTRGGKIKYLVQGTLYPDVIESVSFKGPSATIKSHHNVGGLPEKMRMKLIEPLRELFKDEVREIGKELGLPFKFIGRHPFPGPGLAVRILSDVTEEKLNILREVDNIFIKELIRKKLYNKIWQAFAVLLPVQSVGVMGDERSYENVIALRAVNSTDGMTADVFGFDNKFLQYISGKIVNEVKGVNRVVYDITSKPPATIEWE